MTLRQKEIALKKKLEYHYKYFDFSQISPDPLEFPHRFKNFHDIEVSAFISSVFAYGNVKQINDTLKKIHAVMKQPHRFVMNYKYESGLKKFSKIKHRFYTTEDIARLFYALNRIYTSYGSLNYLFLLYYFDKDPTLKNSIAFFTEHFNLFLLEKGKLTNGLKFMSPDPMKGSACKRMNLFLRWMIRKDELDFGLWKEFSPSQLLIPVDTHVAKICKDLGLTKQKTASWKMAEEITQKLKKFDPTDPVKYDFAICHIGMRKMEF